MRLSGAVGTASVALLSLTVCVAAAPILKEGDVLSNGDCLTSVSGKHHCCLRAAGVLEVVQGADSSKPEKVLYRAGVEKGNKRGAFSAKLLNGDLVIVLTDKRGTETEAWCSGSEGGSYAYLDDTGSLTLYQPGWLWDTAVWSSTPTADGAHMALGKDTVKEPVTGVELPAVDSFGGGAPLRCIGAGVRAKTLAIVNVNVYALGLYVEPKAAAKALDKYRKASPSDLSGNKAFYGDLMKPGAFERALRLSFVRDVGSAKVTNALTAVKGVPDASLKAFTGLLSEGIGGGGVRAGDEIVLQWAGKDELAVHVRGKKAGSVKDAALPPAVFELYLGDMPVSPQAKEAFASGFSALF